MDQLRCMVLGASGRMGRMLVRAVLAEPRVSLVSAADRPSSSAMGRDAGEVAGRPPCGIVITSDLEEALSGADCVLDFTTPEATSLVAPLAAARGMVHVVGTTGLGPGDFDTLRKAGLTGRIVQSGNMSLGVNLLAMLVRQAAAALAADWDIEIVEMHHRMKVDAPSGTALLLGEAAAEGRGIALAEHSARGRDGHTGIRRDGDIGFASLRGGSVIGEHSVVFATAGERIELTHRAEDRGLFANGAVKAALWARDQPAGSYSMADVLGLKNAGG